MPARDETPADSMTRLAFGFIPSRAAYVVAKLGIPDLMRDGPRRPADLASLANVDPDALFRIMRLLAGSGVLRQEEGGLFSLTRLGETLCSNATDSLRDWIILCHEGFYPTLAHMTDSVRTGEPAFVAQFGKDLFEATRSDPAFRAVFHKGLASRTRQDAAAVAEAYDFSQARKIADLGGGSGSLLSAILSRQPHLSGVLFDIAPAVEAAKSAAGGPLPRTAFVTGDFFKDVPVSADVYLLKWILHDWTDDDAVRILRACRRSAAADSKLLVIEGLLGAPNELTLTNFADINMMLMTGRGRERTEAEFSALFERSGFALRNVIPTRGHLSILEAVPV